MNQRYKALNERMGKGVHLYIGSHMGTHLWTKEVDQIKDQNSVQDQKWTYDQNDHYEASDYKNPHMW